jgi:hypothetical protein
MALISAPSSPTLAGLSQMPTKNQQDGEGEGEQAVEADPEEALKRFRDVICALHHQLLELIQNPPPIPDADAISAIQHEAGQLLVLGVELFYPSQVQKCQILSELVSYASGFESPSQDTAHCSGKGDVLTGKAAAEEVLLKPLVERFLDDNLALSLIPKVIKDGTRAPPDALVDLDGTTESVKVLLNTLQLLLQRILQVQFADVADRGFMRDNLPYDQPQGPSRTPEGRQSGAARRGPMEQHVLLLVQLLLVLQKHIMNFAGSQAPQEVPPPAPENKPCPPGSARGKTILEAAGSSLHHHDVPASWICIDEYVQFVLSQSIEALTQLPGLIEERNMRAPTAPQIDCISSQELSKIEGSFIGTGLPSLVTGLMHFAFQPFFALKLMSQVTDFYRLLNRVCAALPDVVALDAAFLSQRSGEVSFTLDAPAATTPSVGNMASPRHEMSLRRKRGGGAPVASVDPLKLPPLYCLIKSLAFLAGRLAGMLCVGEGDFRKYLSLLQGAEPKYSHWLSSSLLQGGLEPSCSEVLGRPVVFTPTRRPKAPAQNSRTCGHPEGWLSSGRGGDDATLGLPTSLQVSAFLDALCVGRGPAKEFIARLRNEHMARDVSLAPLRRQADSATGALVQVEAMERVVCAAIIKHTGLSLEAVVRASAVSQKRPLPGRFSVAWMAVAEVRFP